MGLTGEVGTNLDLNRVFSLGIPEAPLGEHGSNQAKNCSSDDFSIAAQDIKSDLIGQNIQDQDQNQDHLREIKKTRSCIADQVRARGYSSISIEDLDKLSKGSSSNQNYQDHNQSLNTSASTCNLSDKKLINNHS